MSAAPVVPLGVAVRFAMAVALFLLAANAPYAWLVANFGYDDILREPAGVVLERFSAGGVRLVLAWLAFSIGALLFVPVALQVRSLLRTQRIDCGGAVILGVVSAVAQATGLLRWVLVVPVLAAAYVDPAADDAARQMVLITFEAIHRFGGALVGEMLGQVLLAGWTAMTVTQLARASLAPRWLVWIGAVTPLMWVLGLSEPLNEIMPAMPSIEITPAAFMVWEAWLAALAVVTLWRCVRVTRRANGPAPSACYEGGASS